MTRLPMAADVGRRFGNEALRRTALFTTAAIWLWFYHEVFASRICKIFAPSLEDFHAETNIPCSRSHEHFHMLIATFRRPRSGPIFPYRNCISSRPDSRFDGSPSAGKAQPSDWPWDDDEDASSGPNIASNVEESIL